MPRMHKHIDVDELEDLTLEGWSTERLANRYAVRRQYIHWVRVKYGLTRPQRVAKPDAPNAGEDEASADSLALSPYVLRRIEELGIHGRRVQPVDAWSLPVFSGG